MQKAIKLVLGKAVLVSEREIGVNKGQMPSPPAAEPQYCPSDVGNKNTCGI